MVCDQGQSVRGGVLDLLEANSGGGREAVARGAKQAPSASRYLGHGGGGIRGSEIGGEGAQVPISSSRPHRPKDVQDWNGDGAPVGCG